MLIEFAFSLLSEDSSLLLLPGTEGALLPFLG